MLILPYIRRESGLRRELLSALKTRASQLQLRQKLLQKLLQKLRQKSQQNFKRPLYFQLCVYETNLRLKLLLKENMFY